MAGVSANARGAPPPSSSSSSAWEGLFGGPEGLKRFDVFQVRRTPAASRSSGPGEVRGRVGPARPADLTPASRPPRAETRRR